MSESNFWDDIKGTEPTMSEDETEHIAELTTIPQTQRTSLRWNPEDNDLFGEVPAPLTYDDTKQRIEYVDAMKRELWSQNKRINDYLLKALNDYSLLQFDLLSPDDQKVILDQRHASVDEMAYRKHRTQLHQTKIQAESTLRRHRCDLEAYMKLPSACELADDEQRQLHDIYAWLLYQLNFDSMKWLKIPRSYNRKKMITELMIRLFIETYFVCTYLTAEQIRGWLGKDVKSWKLLLEKQVIFIAIDREMVDTFWDLLFDELQTLVTSGKSVIFIAHFDPAIPDGLKDEYRSIALPQNATYCRNMKFDRTTYEFSYSTPSRTETQSNDGSTTNATDGN